MQLVSGAANVGRSITRATASERIEGMRSGRRFRLEDDVAAIAVSVQLPAANGTAPIVVIGSGPSGLRVVQELLRRRVDGPIVLCGAEMYQPYNRVGLSSFLMGEIGLRDLRRELALPASDQVSSYLGSPIVSIDRSARRVKDASGREHRYSDLVLAVGSAPHVPQIAGTALSGVFTFRDFRDAERLFARRMRSRHTVVLGGGLLGLEAARAMHRFGTRVTVIDHNDRLMARQLDMNAAAGLEEHIEALGIEVILGSGARAIAGELRVDGVQLRSGRTVACDTVIIATGIRPNIDLALRSGLHVGRGIRIDDATRTSDPHVFAVGECAEHRDVLYGLVAPGLEQASVAAANLAGQPARYLGSTVATQLKVVGLPVFSVGVVAEEDRNDRSVARAYRSADGAVRGSLVIERGRLVGAAAVGHSTDTVRIHEAVTRRRRVWPWQARRFARSGRLWPRAAAADVAAWPKTATICNCTGVTRGQIADAVRAGCASVQACTAKTGAGSVCGSCRPLLHALIGGAERLRPVSGAPGLALLGALTAAATLPLLLPWNLPDAASRESAWHLSVLWRDADWKELTGYTLLAAGALSTLLSARKRLPLLTKTAFAWWRIGHMVLGATALLTLWLHTGGRLGANLNLALAAAFVGLLVAGSSASLLVANEHRLGALATPLRRRSVWLHIGLAWPVPLLLTFHVLQVYFF
jgi:nitrite reductase (NADH) large subunit